MILPKSTESNPGSVPSRWEIDEAQKPKDPAKFLESITFLKEHPEWIQANLKEAQDRFSLLARTDVSKVEPELSHKASDIHLFLIKTYPNLFSTKIITLKMKSDFEVDMEIPEELLIQKSERFKKALQCGGIEQQKQEIELIAPQGMSKETCEAFFTYLKTGKIDLTGENVLLLQAFAHEHLLSDLSKTCCSFLLENLEPVELKEVLLNAIRLNNHDLKWVCLIIASRDSGKDELQSLLKSLKEETLNNDLKRVLLTIASEYDDKKEYQALLKSLKEEGNVNLDKDELTEALHILNSGKLCNDLKITPSFTENTRTVSLNDILNVNQLDLLKSLSPFIEGLEIKRMLTNDKDLEDLSNKLKVIHRLCIISYKITTLPKSWLANLLKIDCNFVCTALTTLISPVAKEITCAGCTAITTIQAPAAEIIDCGRNLSLKTLEAPVAKKICCSSCNALTTLQAPAAEIIDCSNCTNLKTLEAPVAKKICCRSCNALTTLQAPAAEEIDCRDCLGLKTIQASIAKKINCYECRYLKILQAETAKEINCGQCRDLTTLQTPAAEKINSAHCTSLITLVAPVAKQIECDNCKSLKTLHAPLAKIINCGQCRDLTTLQTPAAEKINSAHCTSLITLEAPVAKEIECRFCPALKILQAPLAKKIYCYGCTSLTTIQAPAAEEIDCRNCTDLKTIQASIAKKIVCEGCDGLKSLTVNKDCKIIGKLPTDCKVIYKDDTSLDECA